MNAPAKLTAVTHPQALKLDRLIRAAMAARADAERGDLFASRAGMDLIEAVHDLLEVDAIYKFACPDIQRFAADVEHELRRVA